MLPENRLFGAGYLRLILAVDDGDLGRVNERAERHPGNGMMEAGEVSRFRKRP